MKFLEMGLDPSPPPLTISLSIHSGNMRQYHTMCISNSRRTKAHLTHAQKHVCVLNIVHK